MRCKEVSLHYWILFFSYIIHFVYTFLWNTRDEMQKIVKFLSNAHVVL